MIAKFLKSIQLTLLGAGLVVATMATADDEPASGQIAPDFQITRLDGSEFQLSDYRGKKAVYLVFWNTWCTYCMKKIPKLLDAQANLAEQIEIIAVNTGLKDSVEKSLAFQQKFAISYPLAFDHDKAVTDRYGVWGTPTEFIIDINGVIQHRDHIPDDLRAHLSNWNQLSSNTSLAVQAASECLQERQLC